LVVAAIRSAVAAKLFIGHEIGQRIHDAGVPALRLHKGRFLGAEARSE
jgi:hypothetical protein